jgi:hypothetical protein
MQILERLRSGRRVQDPHGSYRTVRLLPGVPRIQMVHVVDKSRYHNTYSMYDTFIHIYSVNMYIKYERVFFNRGRPRQGDGFDNDE